MTTHSSILVWRIPWTEEPGGLLFIGSQRVGHDWSDLTHVHMELQLYKHYSFLSSISTIVHTGSFHFFNICIFGCSPVFPNYYVVLFILFSLEHHAFIFISEIISSMTYISILDLIHLLSFPSFSFCSFLNSEIYNSRDFSIYLNTFCVYI